jgi:hypothetical protein
VFFPEKFKIMDDDDALDTVTMARKEREKYGQFSLLKNKAITSYLVGFRSPLCIKVIYIFLSGRWEIELSYGGEVDLHKHYESCEKNPDHKDFIPVDQFNVKDVPHGYKDNNILVELVKAISDLTVRVSVIDKKRLDLMKVGSGLVNDVRTFTDDKRKCDCKECLRASEKPRTNFAYIRIRTSARVVSDKDEAANATCHFFFDRGDTPDACNGVVTLSGATPVWIVPEADWCDIQYVTHDQDLIDKLRPMIDHLRKFGLVISKNYPMGIIPPLEERSCAPGQFLTIIESHLHGGSKRVSIGYTCDQNDVKDVNRFYLYRTNLLYNTATCPGSIGAHVWVCDGSSVKYPYWSQHSGIWNENLNYCTSYSCFNNNTVL